MTEPRRDRWGRYLLPDPETGESRPWTRATTWAASAADSYGLTKWKMRMVAKGVATRRDLYMLAASLDVGDKGQFDKLTEQAIEAAGGGASANLGTALHAFTEQADRGESPEIPEPWDRDIAAYKARLDQAGIEPLPRYIERIVVLPELGVAGTLDRIVRLDGSLYIADVKTGADLSFSWGEIAIQLALYANAGAMWNGQSYEPHPVVDADRAIVIHLPAGQAKCDLYWVDIIAGWVAAVMCGDVRAWRTRKDLAVPFDTLAYDLQRSLEEVSSGAAADGRAAESPPTAPAPTSEGSGPLVVSQDADGTLLVSDPAPDKSSPARRRRRPKGEAGEPTAAGVRAADRAAAESGAGPADSSRRAANDSDPASPAGEPVAEPMAGVTVLFPEGTDG